MKPFLIIGYVFVAFALGILVWATSANANHLERIESTYNVSATQETHFFSSNRLIVEKDGQKLTCDVPSLDNVETKTPLNCDAPGIRIDAEK